MEGAALSQYADYSAAPRAAEHDRALLIRQGAAEEALHVVLIEPAGRSGITQFVYSLANALAETRTRVTVLTAEPYELEHYPRQFAVEKIFRGYRTDPVALFRAARRLTKRPPCVIDLHGATHPELYLPLLYLFRWATRARVVYTAHDPEPRHHQKFPAWVLRSMYGVPDRIHVFSPGPMETIYARYHVAKEKFRLIPFGNYLFLGDQRTQAQPQPESRMPHAPTILFFGFITPNKGLLDLIRAFALVKEAIPEARLQIVGQPAESFEKYHAEIQRLHLDASVRLHLEYVPLARLVEYVQECDVVAVPYRSASQSAVIQVAYAFEKPLVATQCEGVARTIVHGKSGLLTPVGDVAALSAALIELLRDEPRRRVMGAYGRKLTEAEFSFARTAQETLQGYQTIGSLRKPTRCAA